MSNSNLVKVKVSFGFRGAQCDGYADAPIVFSYSVSLVRACDLGRRLARLLARWEKAGQPKAGEP